MVIQKPNINIITCILDEDKHYLDEIKMLFEEHEVENFVAPEDIESFIKEMSDDLHICVLGYNLGDSFNGIQLMDTILDKNPNCYIIMVSAQESIDIVTDFYDRDGFKYIRKGTPNFLQKLVASIKKAKSIIQRNFDFHFDMIEKFNKTQETFKDARHTIDNSITGSSSKSVTSNNSSR